MGRKKVTAAIIAAITLLLLIAVNAIRHSTTPAGDGWIIPATYAGIKPGQDASEYNHQGKGIIAGAPFSHSNGMKTAYFLTKTSNLPKGDSCATQNPDDIIAVSMRSQDGKINAVACQSDGEMLQNRERAATTTKDLEWATRTSSQFKGLGTLSLHKEKSDPVEGTREYYVLHWSQDSDEKGFEPFSRQPVSRRKEP